MKRITVRILLSLLVSLTVQSFAEAGDDHDGWSWTFAPAGRLWVFQHTRHDPLVTWDFGAELNAQIGEGYGHAVWFGGLYRQAAGFDEGASITPFDPRHIDSAQLLTWQFRLKSKQTLFTHWQRWCYHEIDIYNRSAIFFTHAALGYGTVSPPEAISAGPRQAHDTGRLQFDFYVSAGPIIHGGPKDVLGNWPRWQGIGDAWAAVTVPVKGILVLEGRVQWSVLMLKENEPAQLRHRGDLRISAILHRDRGNLNAFVGYRLHDDWPYRQNPAAAYVGIGYRI